ncbi:Syntaxin-binding protein 5-like protein, partial [Cucurbita argyrosperma subsp. sororia]
MFSKFFHKPVDQQSSSSSAPSSRAQKGVLGAVDLDPRVTLHYGIPPTASILAYDPIQSLLAVGTLDGRIKVLGGDSIEAIFTSTKPLPFKNLEFLHNQGFLVSISNDNEIQVWELERRQLVSTLRWESNITAFSVLYGTCYMYVGSEYAMVAVLKFDAEERKIKLLPYYLTSNVISDVTGVELPDQTSVVGVLLQPCSLGNRLLIAYENGLLVLWDASEDRAVLVRGHKDLELTESNITNHSTDVSDLELEKEISSLCWVTSDGSILAVGYVDGDILFWNFSNVTSSKDQQVNQSRNNAVKLQLSSGDRRLPVILLRWSPSELQNHKGELFVYGGDEIGSPEVLTILSLDWSPGMKSLKCMERVDLTLDGSFADIVLSLNVGEMKRGTFLFVLANPGQLQAYDNAYLSSIMAQQKKISSGSGLQYPMVIPNIEPRIMVAKLGFIHREKTVFRALNEVPRDTTWPLTGGIPCQLHDAEDYQVERVYIAGYQDGSIRIWDATYPSFSRIFSFEPEVIGLNIAGLSASISALDFCSVTLSVAAGNECGLVRLYKLIGSSEGASLHYVTETKNEVHNMHGGEGIQCVAVFSVVNSSVSTLSFENCGAVLAVGFECGQVAVFDTNTLSLLYLTNDVSNSRSPVISLAIKSFPDTNHLEASSDESIPPRKGILLAMTKNSYLAVLDSTNGEIISFQSTYAKESSSISMYIIESDYLSPEALSVAHAPSTPKITGESYSVPANAHSGRTLHEVGADTSSGIANLFVLLCCETALYLHPLKLMNEGENKFLQKVNLSKPCCWTTMLKKDGKVSGLVVLYQNGVIEIRSFQNLEQVVWESSLTSILRWSFKTNMEKTICSSDDGQIMLLNGTEFAVVSLLIYENAFRIPESFPSLHDEVLAAATEASNNFYPSQNKQDATVSGFLESVVKGFKGSKVENDVDPLSLCKLNDSHLESLFSYPPFLKPSKGVTDELGVIELDIDDIEIDEPLVVRFSPKKNKNEKEGKRSEKEKLFEGGSTDSQPKMRTAEEIKAKYRKAESASTAAEEARNKLLERQQKLDKLRERTEELQNGAESFADMAKELAKRMENRKWWQL